MLLERQAGTMGKLTLGCILALTLAGFGLAATPAVPAPATSLLLPSATDADLAALKGQQNLLTLDLSNSKVTDVGLVALRDMKGLQTLILGQTQVTDAGLVNLRGMKGLQFLDLSGTHVTDAGLAILMDMISVQVPVVMEDGDPRMEPVNVLHTLILSQTQVTDAALANLKGMTDLQTLLLAGTQVTDAGLACLNELPCLTTLSLQATQVTDAGLANLQEIKSMQSLNLGGARMTDAGLASLKKMTGLKTLNLGSTQVTDAGLRDLKEHKDLRCLDLSITGVTVAGFAQLRAALPDTQIIGPPSESAAPGTPPNLVQAPPTSYSWPINASSGDNGAITSAGMAYVADEAAQSFTFYPGEGYQVSQVIVDGNAVAGNVPSYTFYAVHEPHSILVTFAPAPEPVGPTVIWIPLDTFPLVGGDSAPDVNDYSRRGHESRQARASEGHPATHPAGGGRGGRH